MADNIEWFADINVRIDQAGTLADLRRLQSELKGFEGQIDKTEATTKQLNASYGRIERAQQAVRMSLKTMIKDFGFANGQLQNFQRNFAKAVQMDVAGGSMDGKGTQRAQEIFRTNEAQARRLVATYDAMSASGVTALRRIIAESDKAAAAQKRLNEAAAKKLGAAQSNYSGSSAQLDYQIQTQGMDRAQKAAHALTLATRNLAKAETELAAARRSGDVSRQTAALNAAAQAQRAAANAARSNAAAQAEASNLAARANQRLVESQRAISYARLSTEANSLASAERKLAEAKNSVATAQSRVNSTRGGSVENSRAVNELANANIRLANATRTHAEASSRARGNLESQRYAMYEIGAAYALITRQAAQMGSTVIRAFAQWESQMSQVQRTSNTVGGEFQELSDGLVQLGDRIPTSTKDINDMAIAAGQLGISGTGNILAFTEAISKFVAISDTVTARDAAEQFGRLANLTGLKDSANGYEQLASSVAQVGVTAAATDAQILKTSQEVAQAAAGSSLAADAIIGLSGAFASLGVPPERARSVINDLVKVMNKGLPTASGAVAKLGELLGISAEEAAKLWRENPAQAISGMARAMGDLKPEEIGAALADMGIKGARAVPVFSALAKDARAAGDGVSVLESALMNATLGFEDPTKLSEQYKLVLDDLTTSWQLFANSSTTLGAKVGATVAPALKTILGAAQELIIIFRNIVETPVGGAFTAIALGAGTLATGMMALRGASMLAGAQLIAFKQANQAMSNMTTGQIVKQLASNFLSLGPATNRAAFAVDSAGTAVARSTGKFAALGNAARNVVGALGGPWVLAIAAIIGGAAMAGKAVEDLGASFDAAQKNIREATTAQQIMIAGMSTGPTDFLEWTRDFLFGTENIHAAVNATVEDFDRLAEAQRIQNTGFDLGGAMTRELAALREAAERTGNTLADMAETDAPAAATAFEELASSAETTQQKINVLDAMGDKFKQTMYDQGVAAGQITEPLDTYAGKVQLLEYISGQASQATATFEDNIWATGAAAEDTSGYIDEVSKVLEDFIDNAWAGTDAAIALQNAMNDVSEAKFEPGEVQLLDSGEIDITGSFNTEAATEAADALKGLQQAYFDTAVTVWESTGSYQAVTDSLNASRESWIQAAMDMGFTETQAYALADAYFGIPEEVITHVIDEGTIDATGLEVGDLTTILDGLPPNTPISVQNLTPEVKQQLEDAGYELEMLDGSTAQITTNSNAPKTEQEIESAASAVERTDGLIATITTFFDQITRYFVQDFRTGGSDKNQRFAEGGFTGRGGKYDTAGIVHAGEYVIPKKYVDQTTGLPKPEALSKLTPGSQPSGQYAGGGRVQDSAAFAVGPLDLSAASIQALAAAMAARSINLDGTTISENSAKHYGAANRMGKN